MPRDPGEPKPDARPRWALIELPYNRIKPVLLATLDRWIKRGATVIAREDEEMFTKRPFDETNWDANLQSNPKREDDPE